MEKFLEFVASIFECNVCELNMDTAYGEFPKWYSMMQLNLTMGIEEEYGINIPIDEIPSIKTLADLYGYVK